MKNECLEEFNNLINEYENDNEVLEIIYKFIKNDMRGKIRGKNNERKKIQDLLIKKHNYIDDFLDNEIKYYALKNIKEDSIYIKYDGISFKYCTKDEIILTVIHELTIEKSPLLSRIKYDIADDILRLISNRNLFEAMPESTTIQDVITFFFPMFFYTKEELKYFLTVIGDTILKKNSGEIYYVPEHSREFLSLINVFYKDYTGTDAGLNNFKFKYRGQLYKNSRLISINNNISNIIYLNEYVKKNIFNIIVVSCHYSFRYQESENYLMKQNIEIKNKILYLANNNKDNIIDHFFKENIQEENECKMNQNDLYFLWKLFCDKKHMPRPLYQNEFFTLIENKCSLDSNGKYINLSSPYLEPAKYFNKFWSYSITITEEGGDYFELSEICELYNIWLKKKEGVEMIIKENQLKELIQYFYPSVKFRNNMILDRKCIFWKKKEDIGESIKNKFMKNIDKNLTFLEAYLSYCSYCDKKKKLNIVSKKYFEKYIGSIIPQQYIKNKVILKDFWVSSF